ncbi:MAG: choice-of-anchor D domain-containing protein [Ignavibacteria bacterium]|nr:choice-of-anchor D domain-containing protein [Ignavibacteria bacterium]MBP7092940.1 choice-of-anchor D domain-containing protein [Candidatus Kapabacteria bacterium]MBK6418605.1 choice-of-anchor D domain-containing protein [Ignavibacteria bacterium]MBK6760570.1 choice-of-anchor D domain-containing protein [Ignavibacteria bacterium]MBK7411614.1 choice-of-anchor D domain-containing protein [Ignavibacteria bacterium]
MRLVSTTMKTAIAVMLMVVSGFGVISAQVTERRGTLVLTEGRRYLVAFPQVWASPTEKPMPQPMQLLISSKTKTTVRIQTPAGINDAAKMDKEYTVEANKVLKVPISTAYMNVESETRKGYGIMVSSKKPISVSTYQAWQGNGEMARHLPVEGWGKNYYTMNFYQDRYGNSAGYKYRPGQILIIADKDNTVVSYTPTVDTEGGIEAPSVRKGATQTVTLEKGETFLIKAKINEPLNKEWETDLTSTWIRANKPVGVVSGHTKVAIMRYPDVLPPTGMFAAEAHFVRNNVHDAMLPLEMSGTKFVTTPCMYTPTRVVGQASIEFGIDDDRGDVIRVVGLEDGTTVKAMRQDGSGLLNKFILKKGETRLETALEVATYWESDKPILMGQYGKSYAKILPPLKVKGKDGEEAQGHPTVESGMPMLQYIPSVDRWVEYGVFHAPEGMDNFFNIVFKSSEIGKIKVDGRSLTSAFGGAMRLLKGTDFAYIRTPIGSGDHVIESTDNTVRWAAWNYGSLDGLQQGRAYGTPISIDMTIPCDDSLAVNEVIVCGDVQGKGNILPENTTCGSIFAVYPEDLNNYELIVDENFSSGDKVVDFQVKVLDKTKDATATIKVVSRSGKFVEKTYTYIADKISWTPTKINFGTIAYNTPSSATFTIKNEKTDRPVLIRKIKVIAQGTVFAVSPEGPVSLGPSESKEFTATATIQTAPEVIDTVLVELECYDQKTVELRVRGEEPKIYVSDVDWGTIPASSPGVERTVEIRNGSRVALAISGYNQALMPDKVEDGNFFNPRTMDGKPLLSAFPLTIAPNDKYEFKVTYSPKNEIGVRHTQNVPFYSNAKEVDSIAILNGMGNNVQLAAYVSPWVERVIDVIQTNQNIQQYTQQVKFENLGAQAVTYFAPQLRGADASNFRIVDNGNAGSFPIQLVNDGANTSRYITIAFVPTVLPNRAAERNNYTAELFFPTTSSNGVQTEVAVTLQGTAWQPQVKGADLDFPGIMNVGDAAQVLEIPISNEHFLGESNPTTGTQVGTYDVVVTGITITDVNTKFELLNAPTPTSPWVIKPGEVPQMLQVRFDPTVAGDFSSPYVISTNVGTKGQAAYEPSYKITARVQGGDFSVEGATAEQYVFNSKDMVVRVKHTENTTIRFNIAQPSGPDAGRFTVTDQYIDVPPGPTGATFNVTFTPDFVTKLATNQTNLQDATNEWTIKAKTQGILWRTGLFSADIEITDDRNAAKKQVATVTGNGLFLETTDLVKDNYNVAPGASTEVAVELNNTPESLDAVGITELRVRLAYDPKLVKPRINTGDIITTGTQSEGWTVLSVSKNGAPGDASNSLEIDIADRRTTKSPLRNINVPVFKVTFDAFLDKGQAGTFVSPLNVYAYTVDFDNSGERVDYTLFRDIPGKITVTLPCATTTRLVSLGSVKYAVNPMRPNPVTNSGVISYSVGLTADTRIVLYNSNGEAVQTLLSDKVQAGTYEMTVDFSTLSAGTYYYRVVSGPFTSELQTVSVVK